MSRSKAKEEKSQLIINTALKVFSEKGYDNATIGDIAKSAKVSMGLPLYYFTNKEELACQALEFSSKQITHSILKDISGNSPEEIAASFINSFRKNIKIEGHSIDGDYFSYEGGVGDLPDRFIANAG